MICPVCGKISDDNPFNCVYCGGSGLKVKSKFYDSEFSGVYRLSDSSDGNWSIQVDEILDRLNAASSYKTLSHSNRTPVSKSIHIPSSKKTCELLEETPPLENIYDESNYEDNLKNTLSSTYEIIRKLGHGGMASVYLAREMELGREVAIKIFSPKFMSDEQFIDRFRREARILANLDNNHIVKIYHISEKRNPWYFIMSYLPGGTLLDKLNNSGPIEPSEIAKIAIDVCSALSHAHGNGIIHRDIKPENILFDKNGEAVLTDFGIAHAEAGLNLTRPGMVIGTPLYMSPEQAKGIETDCRSDIYSFGIVLYQMATGVLPFRSEDALSIMYKHVHEIPELPVAKNPGIPQWLENIIFKCIDKSPDDRYQSMSEISDDFYTALHTKPHKSLFWFLP